MLELEVFPGANPGGAVEVPSSKPETQRAILIGALARGTTHVQRPVHCPETAVMKRCCSALGATITETDGELTVTGSILDAEGPPVTLDCQGSALAARIFAALAPHLRRPVTLTGDAVLRSRVMAPLFDALRQLGAQFEFLDRDGLLPVRVTPSRLPGGTCRIRGDVSSEFITALLIAAPLADRPVEIAVEGPVYSAPYIGQTVEVMRHAGVAVEVEPGYRALRVPPGPYRPVVTRVFGDYTLASYFVAKAVLFPGVTRLGNMVEWSLHAERAILDVLRAYRIPFRFDTTTHELVIESDCGAPEGDLEFDVRDCPNILPTLGVIGAYSTGTMRVTGARLTNFHKSPRAQVMVEALRALGADAELLTAADGLPDGFVVRGRPAYSGAVLDCHNDHRILCALFVACLRATSPSRLHGIEPCRPFVAPLLQSFATLGARWQYVGDGLAATA